MFICCCYRISHTVDVNNDINVSIKDIRKDIAYSTHTHHSNITIFREEHVIIMHKLDDDYQTSNLANNTELKYSLIE